MRGQILYEMSLPFGPRSFGHFHGHHGPFGPHHGFGRPCGFGAFGGFGPKHHFESFKKGHKRHGHRNSCEDSSPERECGRGRHGGRHGSPGRHERPEHHHGPHRGGLSPTRGPHGPCCSPPGPHGHHGGAFCHRPPGPHGPHGWHGPGRHGAPHGHAPPPPSGPPCCQQEHQGGPGQNNETCCNRGHNSGSNEETSFRPCHKRCRRGSPRRGCSRDSDSSPERHGRRHGPHRRSCGRPRFHPCGRGRCENRPYDASSRHQNDTLERTRDNRPADAEELDDNQAPGILVQNIVVDNNPRSNSV